MATRRTPLGSIPPTGDAASLGEDGPRSPLAELGEAAPDLASEGRVVLIVSDLPDIP